MSNVIEAERFETLHKLYWVTAYVIKFLKITQKKSKAGFTTHYLHEAELLWIKDSQLGLEKDETGRHSFNSSRMTTRSGGVEEDFRKRDHPFL